MKIVIAAIGHLKTGPEKTLSAEYETRIQGLGRQAGITGLTVVDWAESRLSDAALRGAEEAKNLWSAAPQGTSICVLDERGEALASVAFAKFIENEAQRGAKQLTFMIGGPDGHSADTRAKALKKISFGPMTWPHRMVRVMLLEQIYRSVTILVNHPYHRA